MTTKEAIQTIIDNEAEIFAVHLLLDSFDTRLKQCRTDLFEKKAKIREIYKLNEFENNAIERRDGIRALCEE